MTRAYGPEPKVHDIIWGIDFRRLQKYMELYHTVEFPRGRIRVEQYAHGRGFRIIVPDHGSMSVGGRFDSLSEAMDFAARQERRRVLGFIEFLQSRGKQVSGNQPKG